MSKIYLPTLKVASKMTCSKGRAAVGYLIYGESKKSPERTGSDFLGSDLTPNLAEYRGLKKALDFAVGEFESEKLLVILNNELVVKQLTNQYRINDSDLESVAEEIWEFKERFDSVRIEFTQKSCPWVEKAKTLAKEALR